MEKPVVRFLDIQPYGDNVLLRDPYGISEPIVVNRATLLLMSLFDGSRDVNQVVEDFRKQFGVSVSAGQVLQLIKELDDSLLLYNDNFKRRLEEERERIIASGIKEAYHVGGAYPSVERELRKFLDSNIPNRNHEGIKPLGLLVPHMDMRVAVDVYGKTYAKVPTSWEPELVLILGVSHYVHETPFSVCPLDFKTPFGIARVDKEAFKKVQDSFDYDLTQDIFSYRMEHSIEFQVVFVQHLFPKAKILPAIVSHGDESLLSEVSYKLLRALEPYIDNLLVISSVDMSHVGKKFGDPANYDPSDRDREYIELLKSMKGEEAFKLLESDGNRTRIDGQFTNYVFLKLLRELGAKEGDDVDYRVWYEEATDSSVSFAGMVFK